VKAEILSIGTELLLGSILNTNARFLSQKLAESGVDVYRQTSVGDNVGRIAEAFAEALRRSDAVVASGGLGPTKDDVTLEGLARFLGRPLAVHQPTWRHIKQRLESRGYKMTSLSGRQCRLPVGAIVFPNPVGTAPALLCETVFEGRKKWIAVFPGPPQELEPLFKPVLTTLLRRANVRPEHFIKRTIRISGLLEIDVARKVPDLLKSRPPLTVGIYAKPGEVELAVMSKHVSRAKALAAADRVEKTVRRRFGADVYGVDNETVASALGALLRKKKSTLSIAESCTGGLASDLLSDVSGSSDYFAGSLVAYSNRIKEDLLGVAEEVLKKHGTVSPQTAWLMAKNVRQVFGTGYGIAITGIAGPSGGSVKKPVGLVYIALSSPRKITVHENRFYGTRAEIKSRAARMALDLLRRALLKNF